MPTTAKTRRVAATAPGALVLGALGVVFGDIGTSPIYTVQTVFNPGDPHPVAVSDATIYGIVSLIFWAVTLIVTVTYVLLVMRADNHGEGGIMALITLIGMQRSGSARTKGFLVALGIFGASLFLGDSMITPAISVLSAVEGLKVAEPSLGGAVVPITATIIVILFLLQSRGTAAVGRLFGPVMLVWFFTIAACGVRGIADHPAILRALSPTYALDFFFSRFSVAFFALAAVVLAVTGAEALYADMGHFGRPPITRAWLVLVFPACTLSYMGQGALILDDPRNISSPFFLLVPGWGQIPMVFLAAAATVIASQAVITGTYSLTQQAIQLGLLPRLEIQHTSESLVGQIYMPRVNWMLLAAVLALVFLFESSARLASAYGIAVTGTMVVTSLLAFTVLRLAWKWPLALALLVMVPLLAIESIFLGANLAKFFDGGYVPLLIAAGVGLMMWTWVRGTAIVQQKAHNASVSLEQLIAMLKKSHPSRAPGKAVFLTSDPDVAPSALLHNLKHNNVLHDRNLIVTVHSATTPRVSDAERITVEPLSDSFTRVGLYFGYMEVPNVPRALALGKRQGLQLEMMSTSYFLNRRSFRPSPEGGMPYWQDKLFISMTKAASDATGFYRLPSNRVLELGQQFVV